MKNSPKTIQIIAAVVEAFSSAREASVPVAERESLQISPTHAFWSWRGGASVVQSVGWRRSRACGSAPQLGHMRPLAICSLGFYLTTLPGWTVARSRQQWKRLPGTPRRMAAQSRAFASDSHASTNSLRHTLRIASQTQSTGAYPNGLLIFASPSNGRYLKGARPRPLRRPLASNG